MKAALNLLIYAKRSTTDIHLKAPALATPINSTPDDNARVNADAALIATRLGHSRNAVCAKLLRMGLKRGHKPPTAKPKIVSVPKRKPALLAACARRVHKVVSTRNPVVRQPKELTKSQLNAMLAEAAANTARLLR